MTAPADAPRGLARRSFLGCALAYGVAGPILVACSSDSGDSGTTTGTDATPGSGSGSVEGGSSAPAAGGAALVAAADVPVGGGVALTDVKVVVTQPSEGEFKAFSAVCTHQGATIDTVEDGAMVCPLHASRFSIEDGSVEQGPASNPVEEIAVKVEGGQVVRA